MAPADHSPLRRACDLGFELPQLHDAASGHLQRSRGAQQTLDRYGMMLMHHDTMMGFAAEWIANWNQRDLEAVLQHFAEEAEFVSPVARDVVGEAVLKGKERIRAYWRTALDRIPSLHFTLDHATWDAAKCELTVVYIAERAGRRRRACEIMTFDAAGRQIRGEAFYGADL